MDKKSRPLLPRFAHLVVPSNCVVGIAGNPRSVALRVGPVGVDVGEVEAHRGTVRVKKTGRSGVLVLSFLSSLVRIFKEKKGDATRDSNE